MNTYQRVWWEQVRSDYSVLLLLRRRGSDVCHQLHYLQMVTEKLGKAYFWRSGKSPGRSHKSFVRFLQALNGRSDPDRTRIARLLGFRRSDDFQRWVRSISPLGVALQQLAPALANDGPNAEYPWPFERPTYSPATYQFQLWNQLRDSDAGRKLLITIDAAVRRFPDYA